MIRKPTLKYNWTFSKQQKSSCMKCRISHQFFSFHPTSSLRSLRIYCTAAVFKEHTANTSRDKDAQDRVVFITKQVRSASVFAHNKLRMLCLLMWFLKYLCDLLHTWQEH